MKTSIALLICLLLFMRPAMAMPVPSGSAKGPAVPVRAGGYEHHTLSDLCNELLELCAGIALLWYILVVQYEEEDDDDMMYPYDLDF